MSMKGGYVRNVRYNTVEYIDSAGEWHSEGVYFTHADTWGENVRRAELALKRLFGDGNVRKVVVLNGNAA